MIEVCKIKYHFAAPPTVRQDRHVVLSALMLFFFLSLFLIFPPEDYQNARRKKTAECIKIQLAIDSQRESIAYLFMAAIKGHWPDIGFHSKITN